MPNGISVVNSKMVAGTINPTQLMIYRIIDGIRSNSLLFQIALIRKSNKTDEKRCI